MFHVTDNLYFGRLSNGDVRILKLTERAMLELNDFIRVDGVYPERLVEFDRIIESNHWVSIVASVSAKGESHGRFYEARDFHNMK